jgi:hypothetical protein
MRPLAWRSTEPFPEIQTIDTDATHNDTLLFRLIGMVEVRRVGIIGWRGSTFLKKKALEGGTLLSFLALPPRGGGTCPLVHPPSYAPG